MADVRSLLRQQRVGRRIEHAYAAYSDAGKLLCTLCHEHIKAESLWDGHLRGAGHRQRVKALQERAQAKPDGGELETTSAAQTQPHKRKLDEDRDEEMADIPETEEEEPMRKKRSKPDMTVSISAEPVSPSDQRPSPHGSLNEGSGKKDEAAAKRVPNSLTPPMLQRRTSGTPVLGVEMQIPSRPATPIGPTRDGMGGSGSASVTSASALSTPKMQPPGKSPLIPANAGFVPGNGVAATQETGSSAAGPLGQVPVDEDEWAAFEADMIGGQASRAAGAAPPVSADAVISAPAMTAEQLAAKGAEEDQEKRKALADIELEDEKEEATRALEDEFEEMEELEARVQKLKERREALRHKPGSGGATAASARVLDPKEQSVPAGKENATGDSVTQDQGEDDDDDDEDEDEDDWAGFRFRG